MAIITKIEKQKTNNEKVNIYLDNEFACGMYLDTCIKYGLKKDTDIEKERLDELIIESEKQLAFNKTANYINKAFKTEKQVREYLNNKKYEKITINYVINKLKEYDYINDEKYTNYYINTYKNKYGQFKLKQNLISKGISKELIENIFLKIDKDDSLIYNIAVKYIKNKEKNYENTIKLTRFLATRGFSFEDINLVISKLKLNNWEELC